MEVYISSVREICRVPATPAHKAAIRRRRVLRRVDRELEKGNHKAALSLVKQLKAHPTGLLPGFGAAAPKVHRSVASLDENEIPSSLQSVVDAILHSIKTSIEFQRSEEEMKILQQDFGKMMEAESDNSVYQDHLMCMQHEAGHFLVGYMLGVFPRRYKVPSMEDLLQDRFAHGKVEFLAFEFLRDVDLDTVSNKSFSRGKLNIETLKRFSCVILGGVAAEHLLFGYSELLHSDVVKLERVVKWVGFTESEVNSLTRQAAEAAVLILSRQSEAQSSLAGAMALGRSVGFCVEMIERTLHLEL